MDYGFIIKLKNNYIYKESQISQDTDFYKIGMDLDCNMRFYRDSFPENFEIAFSRNSGQWIATCSSNVYIDLGDVRKLASIKIGHGSKFSAKYRSSDSELFSIEFLIDFDFSRKKYDRIVDVSTENKITIGNSNDYNLVLNSRYTINDFIVLHKEKNNLRLSIGASSYGVYHNGVLAKDGAVINNYDFISIADYSFYYKQGTIRTSRNVKINSLRYKDEVLKDSYPKFNRNTRIKTIIDDEKIEILDPPEKPQKQKESLITRLLPSLIMIVAGIATMKVMSPFMLISSGIGVVTAIFSIIENKKDFKENTEERIKKYNNYIDRKRKEIKKHRENEKKELEKKYIDSKKELHNIYVFSEDLFDRSKDDEDFLTVRLGTGNKKAIKEIDYKKQEKLEVEDDLQQIPEKLYNEYNKIPDVPIVCDLKEAGAIGIIGCDEDRYDIFKNIVVDICARQFFSDINLFIVTLEENKEKIHWARLLPHTYNNQIKMRNIVYDDDGKNVIFEFLYKELTRREETKKFDVRYVVFLLDEYGFKSHPVSKFVGKAKDLGVTFVFFGNDREDISQGCDFLIYLGQNQNADLVYTDDEKKTEHFIYRSITDSQINSVASILAPVYTEEISLESSLTKNISLFQLLNIIAVEDLDLTSRWKSSQVYKSMAAEIGVSKNGIISLDLHDKAHGPHGLVAGTTGSGKSEILQTYILSMATLFHPYEVGFVIIDFKGGGMVNQFKSLPHLVGAITNIDGKEINRSLKSIKAELQKRQRLFAQAEVNHIDKYIKKYKSGDVIEPLPHLIVIVDEFAELKADQPEFMKELISAARIGRSLGVHLILATQKPSGQVNEQIWSNSRFKLCLKVQDQQDSNEVLKSPLAAEIKEPGRAYLQVGNNEIFELFQSAYSGAPEKADESTVKEYTIYAMDDAGRKQKIFEKKKSRVSGNTTQLDAVVRYVNDYCEKNSIKKLPDICLPSLSKLIDFPKIEKVKTNSEALTAEVGIYDDPDNQYQGEFSIDISNQNTMIIGSSQSGKTNLLQCIIRNLSTKYTPNEVSIYIVDFASMFLKNFESLNHVGGVVTPSEDEKLKNLMKLLFNELETRKEKLMFVGVSSFGAYKEAGMTDLPQIVFIIDNLTALKELYFEDDDDLLRLCREGLTVGISVIIANSQTSGIGYKYLSNFSSKIALFCNDSGEYSSLFEHCREQLDDIHGRCIVELDKKHYECQTFLAFKGEKEIERVENILEFIKEQSLINNSSAKKIPVIPEILTPEAAYSEFSISSNKDELAVGVDYENIDPVYISFLTQSVLAISGSHEKGKSKFLNYLNYVFTEKQAELFILDDYSGAYEAVSNAPNVCLYSRSLEDISEMLDEYKERVKKRYAERDVKGINAVKAMLPLVFVINNTDAISFISDSDTLMEGIRSIIKKYKGLKSLIIFPNIENNVIQYSSPDLLRVVKDTADFLIFDDLKNTKIFDPSIAVLKKYSGSIAEDDAFYFTDSEIKKIKTIIC